jgi:hypothetical protein
MIKPITQILLIRKYHSVRNSIGEIYINGDFFSYSLEDCPRQKGIKIPGETSIPEGLYKIIVSYSNRFKRDMPLLLDVPGFNGIRCHSGNSEENSSGCILIAYNHDSNNHKIWGSAEKELTKILKNSKKSTYISIHNE